jgi:hypothetical protein
MSRGPIRHSGLLFLALLSLTGCVKTANTVLPDTLMMSASFDPEGEPTGAGVALFWNLPGVEDDQ